MIKPKNQLRMNAALINNRSQFILQFRRLKELGYARFPHLKRCGSIEAMFWQAKALVKGGFHI